MRSMQMDGEWMNLVEQGLKDEMPERNIEQMGYADRVLNAAEVMEKRKIPVSQRYIR